MKVRSIIILVIIIALVCVVVAFGMTGFEIGLSKVEPLPEQVNLGLDLTGGVYAVYEADQGEMEAGEYAAKLDATMGALRNRLDKKGFTEATVVMQGSDRVRVEVPINETSDMSDPSSILKFIGEPAFLEFIDMNGETAITGAMVEHAAYVTFTDDFGKKENAVELQFNSEGAEIFGQITKEAYDASPRAPIPILLDGVELSSPVPEAPIYGGTGYITGDMTPEQASNLAIQIETGALPLKLDEIEVRSISASLGEAALSKSIFAGLVGIAVLFAFMIIYYRLPGLVACIALAFYMFIIILLLAAIPDIQLTLPGIAGIILGIGMAVDSNVIIFERFKEALAVGKTLRSALNSGFAKALRTIIDSNITTVIAAIVIAVFGVGTVKGFGYTLIISIVVSMFTALIVTRSLLRLIIAINIKNKKLYTSRRMKAESAKGGE